MTADTERLAQIEARLDAATPGPWYVEPVGDFGAKTAQIPDVLRERYGNNALQCGEDFATADLIANAPADLRYLLDRLREAERERDELRERHADADASAFFKGQALNEAWTTLARVKALARRYADLGRTEHPRNITKSHDACLLRDLVVLDLQQAITGDDPAPLMDDRSDS